MMIVPFTRTAIAFLVATTEPVGRFHAAQESATCAIAPDSAAAALAAAALFDRDSRVREEAVRALGLRGRGALPDILQALSDRERRVRGAAIEALGDIGGDAALQILTVAMADVDADLRENVVYTARRIGGAHVNALLEMALADPDDAVREAAAEVLDELGPIADRSTVKTPTGGPQSPGGEKDAP